MTTPAIIDIIAAALLAGFTLGGARRGLFRTLAGVLMIILAMTGARAGADWAAPEAAQLLTPAMERHIQRRLDEALPPASGLPGRLDGGPEELLELLGVQGERLERMAEDIREEILVSGAPVLTAAARRMAESMLYGIFYIVLFSAGLVLLRMAARAVDFAVRLPVLRSVNALGGAVLGLAEGALILLILALLARSFGVSLAGSRFLRIYTQLA